MGAGNFPFPEGRVISSLPERLRKRAAAASERQNRANATLGMSLGLVLGAILGAFTWPHEALAFGPAVLAVLGGILGRYATRLAEFYVDIRSVALRACGAEDY